MKRLKATVRVDEAIDQFDLYAPPDALRVCIWSECGEQRVVTLYEPVAGDYFVVSFAPGQGSVATPAGNEMEAVRIHIAIMDDLVTPRSKWRTLEFLSRGNLPGVRLKKAAR